MKSNTSNVVSLTKAPLFLIFLLCSMYSSGFELGFGIKSLGPYVEVGHKFSDSFNIRAGISGYEYSSSENADSSDVPSITTMYLDDSASLDMRQLSLLIDYHPWQGDFRFTGGITDNKIIFAVHNKGDGDFVINNVIFSDQVIDSTDYQLQLTNGISPYFGIGWSTGFDRDKGFSFSGDLGFYYAADFDVNFSAACSDNSTRLQCVMVRINAKKELYYLGQESEIQLLPMFGMGLAYKF
ncbi:MAG: hypothetical protein ACPHTF_02435 [Porticoccaceae bacterium]